MRCSWVNEKNQKYIDYHDYEWGIPNHDDEYLIKMFFLESFQAGLSWECVLNKREDILVAFDNFNLDKLIEYDNNKLNELYNNELIIRNKLKINSVITNAIILKDIIKEYKTFNNFIWSFTNNKTIKGNGSVTNNISDEIALYLKKKGIKFMGSTTIYAYLQAIGIISDHQKNCYKN